MARSTLEIQFTGTPDGIFHVFLGPRRVISHVFRSAGETLDITGLATLDELNANADFQALVDSGDYALSITPGNDDTSANVKPSDASLVTAGIGSATSMAVPFVIRKSFSGLVTGTADDVTIFASNAPQAFRIIDAFVVLSAAVGASTLQVRSDTAGGGSLLVGAMASATAGMNRAAGTTPTASATVAVDGSVYLRRSDRAVAGELFLVCVPN